MYAVPPSEIPPWNVNVKVICSPEQSLGAPGLGAGHGHTWLPDGTNRTLCELAAKKPSGDGLIDASQLLMFPGKTGGMHSCSWAGIPRRPEVHVPVLKQNSPS